MDLSTTYMGLELRSPLICSSSPLCERLDSIRQMEDHGAGAVVLPSLFEEQIDVQARDLDRFVGMGESYAESLSYFPEMSEYNLGPDGYLEHVRTAKAAVRIPVVGSLNGTSIGGWTRYAHLIEQAGADALELNLYTIPTKVNRTGADVERELIDVVREVRSRVRIPLAVKLGSSFTAPANIAVQMLGAGADALVLFNRFYQPDFDLESLDVVPALSLSKSDELRLRLHWTAIISGRVPIDIAVTGGVHTAEDVLKCVFAGAKVTMSTSALLQRGVPHLKTILAGIEEWLERHERESLSEIRGGMNWSNVPDPSAFERANYMKVLRSYALRPTTG